MNIDVSVIIPAWNLEHTLPKAIDSVIKQDFKGSVEIVVVLSESDDNTFGVAKDLQKQHSNIVIVESDRRNPAYNRILGVRHAKGKYVVFLDADDYYRSDYLQVMFDEIEKGYDIVNCSFNVVKNGKVSKNILTKVKEYDSIGACKALLNDFTMRAFLPTKIFRKELLDDDAVPYCRSTNVSFEDLPICFYAFMKAKKVKAIKNPLYYYVNNPTSSTKTVSGRRFQDHLYSFALVRAMADLNSDSRYPKVFRQTILRSKASLWFDGHISRKVLGHGGFKELRLNKSTIKTLCSKEKVDVNKLPMKDFINECLTPFNYKK